jgi:hypothetical protein
MKVVKAATIECLTLEQGEKLKNYTLLARSGTSWQGQLFLESIKAMNGGWHTGETDGNGGMIVRIPSVDEVVDRATDLVIKAEKTMAEHGWSVMTPTADDLLEEGGRPGFQS